MAFSALRRRPGRGAPAGQRGHGPARRPPSAGRGNPLVPPPRLPYRSVDPIDGTKSFVRECPFFSTQIALMRRVIEAHPERLALARTAELVIVAVIDEAQTREVLFGASQVSQHLAPKR